MTISAFYQQAFPILDMNDQYYLREQGPEDTQAFFKYYTDPEVSRFILATIPVTLFEAESEIHYCRNLFKQQQGIFWTIARRDNNLMVGAVGLYINNFHHRAEISYDLDKNYWNQGIMSAAIQAVSHFAFEKMEVYRLEAVTLKENDASKRLLEKNNFVHEGTLHNYKYFKGRPFDIEMFSKVPERN